MTFELTGAASTVTSCLTDLHHFLIGVVMVIVINDDGDTYDIT